MAVAQVVAGLAFGSVAVLADAGHQLVDALGLALGWGAVRLAQRPSTDRRTWGWGRADAIGAELSALVLLVTIVLIIVEAIRRLNSPHEVMGLGVLLTGVAGVAVNGGSLRAVGQAGDHLSVRAARLHLLGDLAGSVVLIAVGAVIRLTGWDRLDSIASLLLSVLLLHSTVGLLRSSVRVLLDTTPEHLDVGEIRRAVVEELAVRNLHHVHVWTVAPGSTALSAHVEVPGELSVDAAQTEVARIEALLEERFGIRHTTLQLECRPCTMPAHD